jgi:hypothetical protein
MARRNSEKVNSHYNEKWLSRKSPERTYKQKYWTKQFKKNHAGKSYILNFERDEFKWINPIKN